MLMKKLFTLTALFLWFVSSALLAQQKRLVLVEEFTNTGCGPCASWSPILDSCLNYRLGDCIAIKYHSGYPEKTDPFYLYDTEAHQAKVDFYHVTGVPATYVDGQELSDRSFSYLSEAITWCMLQPQKCDVTVSKTLTDRLLKVTVKATPYNNIKEGADVRLFVAAIEEKIKAERPYSNGETELNYTMRKMLSPAEGYQLTGSEAVDREMQWDIDFFDNLSQLGVVAFVQDMGTYEILGTAYIGPNAEGENQLALMNLFDTPDLICMPNYYGKVLLRNNGANAITSATLNVKVNGSVKQYEWTGHLEYLERDTLVFDGFTAFQLNAEGNNKVEVWFSDVNGTDAESNTRTSSFGNSVQVYYDVQLKIYTDKKPEETTWKLYNSAGDVIREGGPYTEPRKFVTVNFGLTSNDCYHLEFRDAGGDGIKGAAGNGYYQLFQLDEAGKTRRIAQGDYDGAVFDVFFNLTGTPQPKPRLVLFEEFTNTSCDPCSEFSPSLDKTISERMGDMVAITYHYNFPSPQDPFYMANPADVMARANYYGVSGVPSLQVNGDHVGSWGYEDYLDAYVDGASEVPAKVELHTEAELSADNVLTAKVNVLPLTATLSNDLSLFVAVVEERIEWDHSAPNGERAWNYVMRKLLPTAEGQTLQLDAQKVTPDEFTFTWPVQNFTDETELGLVTFVQDNTTKEILGTAYTPRPNGHAQNVKILEVKNMPQRICMPEFFCDFVVRNTGSEALTSATLCVSINGSVQRTPWTGSLKPLEIATLRSPLFNDFILSSQSTNEVELWVEKLNGTDVESVHKHYTLANAVSAHNAVRLTIMTDQNPGEISWTVLNSAGDVVCQGGPYTEARKKQVVELPLTYDDCYLLEFEDAGGDGISEGRGYYMLHEIDAETGKARLLVQATYGEALHDVFFSLQNVMETGIREQFSDSQSANGKSYDLGGRPATKGLVISNHRKTINK